MKKIFLLSLVMFVMSIASFADHSFSCYHRSYYVWNDKVQEFLITESYDEPSLFVISENGTLFTHTIESMKSTYFIQNIEVDEDKQQVVYDVVSDAGNRYVYVFDMPNKQIRAVSEYENHKVVMVVFDVKLVF